MRPVWISRHIRGDATASPCAEPSATLATYMRDRDPDLDGSVIVEVEGERSGAIDHDANAPGDHGAHLPLPPSRRLPGG